VSELRTKNFGHRNRSCRPQGRLRGFEGVDDHGSCLLSRSCPSPPPHCRSAPPLRPKGRLYDTAPQESPVILQSKMTVPFPRGPYADCAALLPPSLREVAFAKQKTVGVSLLINATPPVTAYAATAPSVRGPRVHAFPCGCVPQRTAHLLRLTAVRHLPFARRGGFADCAARIPRHFATCTAVP